MITVLGFDRYKNARAIEIEGSVEEIQRILEDAGWTGLIILED